MLGHPRGDCRREKCMPASGVADPCCDNSATFDEAITVES